MLGSTMCFWRGRCFHLNQVAFRALLKRLVIGQVSRISAFNCGPATLRDQSSATETRLKCSSLQTAITRRRKECQYLPCMHRCPFHIGWLVAAIRVVLRRMLAAALHPDTNNCHIHVNWRRHAGAREYRQTGLKHQFNGTQCAEMPPYEYDES